MNLNLRNIVRAGAIALLLLALFLTYSFTLGLDRQAIPIDTSTGQILVDSAGWNVRLLNWIRPSKTIEELDVTTNYLTFFVTIALAVATSIVGVLLDRSHEIKKEKLKEFFPVSTVPITTVGVEDIATMTSYYKDADFVTVFSGDFSWLAKEDDISREVDRLANDRKIQFHSSRNRTEVAAAMGQAKLNQYLPLFRFSSPAGFKASLVQMQGGAQYLLYNRREAASKSEIIIFENKKSLGEPISRLNTFVRQLKAPPFIVIVCGETGSGKTKVARQIKMAANAQLISVGDYFRQLTEAAGKQSNDRNTVIDFGRQYLDKFGSEGLAKAIVGKFDKQKDTIVIDGLRPPEAIDYIRAQFPNYLIVYVDAPKGIRAKRCEGFDLNGLDSSIDALVRPVAEMPSVIKIDNKYSNLEHLSADVRTSILEKYSFLTRQ